MKQIESMDFWTGPEDGFGYPEETEQLEKAKQVGLNYVAARMHTRREVKEHLQKKGYAGDTVREVIRFLEEYGYLNDAAYCRSWIHDRIQFHPCGRQKMAFELSKKISDRSLIQQSLEEYFPEEQEQELALAAALKKIESSRSGVSREQLGRFLYTRGFGGSLIRCVLNDAELCEKLEC